MAFEEGNIFFNKIIVIQSLEGDDRKTGTELHSDTVSKMAWKDPNLKTEIINANDKNGFLFQLSKIQQESLHSGVLPFIHFESHGTEDGLSLASGEDIKWTDIIPIISAINKNCGNNLFISVAACWGGNIQFQIKINKPCPFRGFIGPMAKIYPKDILSSFTIFFEELLTTNDFEKAITRLNKYNESGITFHHLNSEAFFDAVVNNYVEGFKNNSRKFQGLKESIVNQLWSSNSSANVLYGTKENLASFLEAHIDQLIAVLKGLRSQFLHIDA